MDHLENGRRAYEAREWTQAYESLSAADHEAPLAPEDLELLATSAHMMGHDDDQLACLERAHASYLDGGETLRAARNAFWVGINLATQGEMARATGWLGRAQRLVEREERDCVEQGYLLLPAVLQHAAGGDYQAAATTAAEAVAIAERFGDPDLFALAMQERGNAMLKEGRIEEGLRLLDETMVAVVAGELSPIVTGLVYCSVIDGCQEVYALGRAQEWTAALTRWCEEQPDMVSFTGRCLVHRAEIMQLHGAWGEALVEARRAGERFARAMNQLAVAQAFYRQGEVHRLRGEFAAAEEAYRETSQHGTQPQPGLALLRLAQGNSDAAAAAIRRVVGETTAELDRARLLPAYVEIMLAAGDTEEARGACHELEEIAAGYGSAMLDAMVAQARGEVSLAERDAQSALLALREASQSWRELGAPYEGARARVLVGLACSALGDDDAATLELEAARSTFTELGATPDFARIESLGGAPPAIETHGLTARELEVLRHLAAGESNREIAAALVISEHTVARHVQNIFAKLGVSSRTAASAFAFEHQLL